MEYNNKARCVFVTENTLFAISCDKCQGCWNSESQDGRLGRRYNVENCHNFGRIISASSLLLRTFTV